MKKRSISFESMAVAIIVLIILMVSSTGFYAYLRFNEVLKAIDKNQPAESKLYASELLFKNITNAENSVKSFSLTKDSVYLDQFYKSTNQAIKNLSRLIQEEDKIGHLHKQVDTLEILIDKKFELLNQFLLLQDPFRVQVALNKVTAEIEESVREEKALRLNKDSSSTDEIYILNTPDPLVEESIDTSITIKKEKKSKFFDWLFNRDKKEDNIDTTKVVETESPNFIKPTFDTIISKKPKLNEDSIEELTLKAIDSGLKKIKQEEIGIERNLKAQELQIILDDRKITLKIQDLIEELKTEELNRLQHKNEAIENSVIRTNRQVLIFSIALFVLLFAMIYILVIYALNNRGYRKAMKAAATKAEEFAASKSRFLANMSHEIRTPMNAILGFTEQISKSPLSKEQQEQLSIVRHSTDHLLHLVNDILDFSKLESGKLTLQLQAFDLHLLIEESISFMQPLLDNKPILLSAEFTVNVPQVIVGDSFRLRQILLNLISNSIKFTEKGEIAVKVDAVLQQKNNETELQIIVQDTGIGMSDSQSKKALNEFEQVNSNFNKSNSGTGLGLTITNKLVSLHRGSIQISSELNKGTIVKLMLPYKTGLKTDLTKNSTRAVNKRLLSNCKILVADDEQFNRKLITTILNKYGGIFTEVENGMEAIKAASEKEFDIILMDARMPELDGVEATKKIRALNIKTPILALSAAIFEDEKAIYLKAGMNHFLAKPFKEKQLIDAILLTLEKT